MNPHNPVMLDEVLEHLAPVKNGRYIDATFGAGGYSRAICNQVECEVCGLDRDITVMPYADALSQQTKGKFKFIHSNFGNLLAVAEQHNLFDLDGIIFDIGVSSMQLDIAERGFSFSKDGDLDMRMDQGLSLTAADIVNTYPETQIADIIFQFGGERKSRKIAAAIVYQRKEKPFTSTLELAQLIQKVLGNYHDAIHPATRTFQALRIKVNDELGELTNGLAAAAQLVKPGGKIVVVTFHSLEDKIVKDYFTTLAGKAQHYNKYKESAATDAMHFELVNRKVVTPSRAEIKDNPRARSAKLRAIRRKI